MVNKERDPKIEEKLEELEREIRKLSNEDQAELFVRLGLPEHLKPCDTIAARDIDELVRLGVLHDWVKIEDQGEHQRRPVITIETAAKRLHLVKDDSDASIDIFATIKNNPASIGHPLILLAILRWVNMVSGNQALAHKDDALQQKLEIAKGHLKQIGDALIEGAKERATPMEFATLYHYKSHWPEGSQYGTLSTAWRMLADDQIKNTRNSKIKLEILRQKLLETNHTTRSINEIISFLDENKTFLSRRRSWPATSSVYDAWRLGLTQDTFRTYSSMAKKQARRLTEYCSPQEGDNPYYFISDIANILGNWLSIPLALPNKYNGEV